MKKFLALAALISVGSVNAEELKFGDLNYFFKAGQHNAGADVLNNTESAKADPDEVDYENYLVDVHYAYALRDDLNLTLGAAAVLGGETEINSGSSADTMGIQNPAIGLNYRLLKQDTSGMNLDFGAKASFKLTDREVGSISKEGNMADPLFSSYAEPRNTFGANVRVGKKWNEANEFYVLAGANYHQDGEYDKLQSGTVEMDGSMDYTVGAFYQYRPVNEFMMAVGLTGTQIGEIDLEEAGAKSTREDHIDYQFSFTAKYLVTERAIAKFMLTHDRREEYDETSGPGKTEINERQGQSFGLGADFLF